MATARLGAVLRHIRNLAADQKNNQQTDGELLRVFLTESDQAAFEALVRRHGPMVLRLCRRWLGNVHDADDAFQATFLILARRATSIRNKEFLASWLHGVAYRMATNARRAAARRRRHEQLASPIRSTDPACSAVSREIQAALDEEIHGLPEIYREPFVLCCLEHRSCDEVASRLGPNEATIRKRLSRARKLLQQRLTRRGVSLTAVLAAIALSPTSGLAAVPWSLLCSTVNAAVHVAAGNALTSGLVSANVVAFVEGVNQAMFLTKAKVATALLLALGLIVAGTGVLTHQALAAKQTETQAASEAGQAAKPKDKGEGAAPVARAQPVAEETLKVRGRVLGPDGKPFAGAKLYLGFVTPTAPAHSVRATSGDDGRFEFAFAKSELHKTNGAAQVMAIAKGHGCDWVKLDPAEKELTLRLTKEVPLSGRILDADGRPVVGAKLTVDGVAAVTGVKQGAFAFVHHLPYGRDNAKDWVGALPGQPAVLSTGADGRFRLTGVGHDRVVSLHLEGPGIATADFGVTPGASVGHVAASSRPIRGVVRDQATGKPLAGASVFLNWYINPRYEQPRWGKAITDKEGRYELLGLAKAQRYNLMATPPKGQLYFQRRVDVQDTPGLDPLTADIDMAQGLTVRGKITDKATGKPVAGAMVDYHPLYANPNVNKLAGFWHPRSEATTGADGSYALTVLPGPGVIGVVGPDPDAFMTAVVTVKERKDFFKLPVVWNDQESYLVPAVGGNAGGAPLMLDSYNALVLLEPSEKEKTLRKDVALALPLERKGRVVGPDGQLIAGVTVSGLWPGWIKVETLKGAEFTVHGLNPRAKRQLVFHHKGKNLGFLLKELPDEKSGPLTVKLQPCGSISGRIVDQDDQPLAGEHIPGGVGGSVSFTTDKEGRFHVEGLVPGLGYVLMRPRVVATVLVEFVVESGKNKDLGDLKLDK